MYTDPIGTSLTPKVQVSMPTRTSEAGGDKVEIKLPGQKTQVNTNKSANHEVHVEERKASEEDVIRAIESANKNFIAYDRKFEFSIHEATKQIMVKVIDASNGEIIRELPSEKVLDLVASLWEAAGIIVDRKV